ncbi:MAG TPA: hypothetical protein H9761_19055, partial [Candidatus Eisenbergiella merdavium]|nr:hypothetical protein [Candidatus Eisenbergiella merdavium]
GNTITRKVHSTKDTVAKADKNPYISNSYLEDFIPIDTEYFTASYYQKYTNPEYHQEALSHENSYQKMNGVVFGGAYEDE